MEQIITDRKGNPLAVGSCVHVSPPTAFSSCDASRHSPTPTGIGEIVEVDQYRGMTIAMADGQRAYVTSALVKVDRGVYTYQADQLSIA